MSAANVGDESYHTGAIPRRMRILAWGDVTEGYQHDSVSHALATIERLVMKPAPTTRLSARTRN